MRKRKILQISAFYIIALAIFGLLFTSSREELLLGILAGGTLYLFSIIPILLAKTIAVPNDGIKEKINSDKYPFVKVFQPSIQGRWIVLIFIFITIVICNWTVTSPLINQAIASIILGGWIIFIVVTIVRSIFVLSENSLEYFNGFGRVELPWKNVIEVVKTPGNNDMLIVRDVSYSGLWKRKVFEYEIPLSIFDQNWRTGEIGKIVEQNANLKFIDK